jgi:hypothetical protein
VSEKITFNIDLGIVGDPVLKFYIDDIEMPGPVFEHVCAFGEHTLRIIHSGKTNQTPEQSVTIDKVVIDGVNIRNIVWINSYNRPNYPEPWATQQREQGIELEEIVKGETVLGHNSEWTLPFTSPFYKYVMEWLQ